MLLKEITFTLSKSKENIKKSKTTAKYLIEFLTSSPVHLFNGKKNNFADSFLHFIHFNFYTRFILSLIWNLTITIDIEYKSLKCYYKQARKLEEGGNRPCTPCKIEEIRGGGNRPCPPM